MLVRRFGPIVKLAALAALVGCEGVKPSETEAAQAPETVVAAPTVEPLKLGPEHQGDINGDTFALGGDVCSQARDQAIWTDESTAMRLSAYVSTPECLTRAITYDKVKGEIGFNDCLNVSIDYETLPAMRIVKLTPAQQTAFEGELKRLRGWRLPASCCDEVDVERLNPQNLAGARRLTITSPTGSLVYGMSVDFAKVDAGEDCALLNVGDAELFQALEWTLRAFVPADKKKAGSEL